MTTMLPAGARVLAIAEDDSWAHLHLGVARLLGPAPDERFAGLEFFDASVRRLQVVLDGHGTVTGFAPSSAAGDPARLERRLQKVMERFDRAVRVDHSSGIGSEQLRALQGVAGRSLPELLKVLELPPFGHGPAEPSGRMSWPDPAGGTGGDMVAAAGDGAGEAVRVVGGGLDQGGDRGSALHNWWHRLWDGR